jgi:predicted Holliday junction resolvase-like endonuclease
MSDNYVTRAELNGSLLRLEEQVRELRCDVSEVYKVLREQNSQFSQLLEREVDKREECRKDMDARMADAVKGKVSYALAVLVTVLSSAVVGLAVAFLSRLR